MSTYTVEGTAKTTTKDAGLIVLAKFEGRTVWSLTRNEETLKQCIYDVNRLGWESVEKYSFVDGGEYMHSSSRVIEPVVEVDTEPFTLADQDLSATCPTCLAVGDESCKSSTGKRASKRHANRPAA